MLLRKIIPNYYLRVWLLLEPPVLSGRALDYWHEGVSDGHLPAARQLGAAAAVWGHAAAGGDIAHEKVHVRSPAGMGFTK
jgi:hypothetical protein